MARLRIRGVRAGIVALALLGAGLSPAQDLKKPEQRGQSERARQRIEREVRHELIMLPWLDVFDNLAYKVEGGTVTLYGQVTRPTLKSDAERVVKSIEGVETVVNRIEVLPASPADDRIRRAMYRAIYGHGAMTRYAMQAVKPIRIVVNRGRVTLEGVVSSESDKTIAGMQARGVPGVFEVKNNLQVAK